MSTGLKLVVRSSTTPRSRPRPKAEFIRAGTWFSFERLTLRSLLDEISSTRIREPRLIRPEEWRKLAAGSAQVCNWQLAIDDSGTIHLPELLARARVLIKRCHIQLLVVDYLTLVRAEGKELRERVGKVADALRILAKSERIAVILLSQLRRLETPDTEPTMHDLRESGDIEAHAHVCLLLHTPPSKTGQPSGEDKIIVGKNRNGPRGPVLVKFDPHRLQFMDPKKSGEKEDTKNSGTKIASGKPDRLPYREEDR